MTYDLIWEGQWCSVLRRWTVGSKSWTFLLLILFMEDTAKTNIIHIVHEGKVEGNGIGLCVCMCMWCVCMHLSVHVDVCAYARGPAKYSP